VQVVRKKKDVLGSPRKKLLELVGKTRRELINCGILGHRAGIATHCFFFNIRGSGDEASELLKFP
jgi:hypothetical protein